MHAFVNRYVNCDLLMVRAIGRTGDECFLGDIRTTGADNTITLHSGTSKVTY